MLRCAGLARSSVAAGGVAALLALTVTASPAPAGWSCEVGPAAGATLGGVTEQNEAVYGVRVVLPLNDSFSAELAVLHLTDHPEEERLGISVTAPLDITPCQLSIRYARPVVGRWLRAHVLGGVGYAFCGDARYEVRGLEPDGPVVQTGPLEVDRRDAIGWHGGIGLEGRIADRVVAALEYRYGRMHSDAAISGLSARTPEGQGAIDAFEKDFWDNNELGLLWIGLRWRFAPER